MTIDYSLIHDQFHAAKHRTSPVSVGSGPFTCYLHPDNDAHFENYAIPSSPSPESAPGAIQALVDTFRSYSRRPRLEYIEACAPRLESALLAAGFQTESRTMLMTCTESTLRIPEPPAGLVLELLEADASPEDYRQFKTVEKWSFGPPDSSEATLEEALELRSRFGNQLKVTAKLEGITAGIGSLTHPHKGVTEAAGIATLPEFRRMGIAGAVTASLCAEAFRRGMTVVFLTAADESAGRVYSRAGFVLTGTHQINISMPG